jgi:ribosomal protein S5
MIRATFDGLERLQTKEQVAKIRDINVEDLA